MHQVLIALVVFAQQNQVTYAQLKDFNSWLRGKSLPNKSGRTYVVKIPLKEEMYYSGSKPKFEIYDKRWIVE